MDQISVLDKGFVRLVDFMGGDEAVIQAARVSHGAGAKGGEKDKKLDAYLLKHEHMSPFEHSFFKFHISLPVFVMRQWIRHRMASYNEISARYTEVKDEFYVPKEWRSPDPVNKQASRASAGLDQKLCTKLVEESYRGAYGCYQALLEAGVAREMARMVLPTSMYTQFYWTVNSRSLMHFICLRADAGAQWEIQRYAEALVGVFADKMPWTYSAFLENMWKGENPLLRKEKERLCGSA
jgi:thymidylate synthase (FAD)